MIKKSKFGPEYLTQGVMFKASPRDGTLKVKLR